MKTIMSWILLFTVLAWVWVQIEPYKPQHIYHINAKDLPGMTLKKDVAYIIYFQRDTASIVGDGRKVWKVTHGESSWTEGENYDETNYFPIYQCD